MKHPPEIAGQIAQQYLHDLVFASDDQSALWHRAIDALADRLTGDDEAAPQQLLDQVGAKSVDLCVEYGCRQRHAAFAFGVAVGSRLTAGGTR